VIHHGTLAARRWPILASAMVSFFAVGMTFFAVPPLIPELRALFELSNLEVGLLMGAIAVPAIVLSIPIGAAVDRWAPRTAGTAGLVMMAVGAALFALAPAYAWLVAGRLLFGLGGLVLNLMLARLIAVTFAGREVALAMGLFTGVYPASAILLYSLHPLLLAALGWRGELGGLALLVVVAVPLHLAVIPARVETGGTGTGTSAPRLALPPRVWALGTAWMLFFAVFAAVLTFAPEWAGGGSRGLLIVSTLTWVQLLGTPLLGAAVDRTGGAPWWCVGGLATLALAALAMATGALPALAAMVLVGVAAAAVPPAVYSLPSRLVPATRVGLAFGFITALSNLGTLAGPAAAGGVRDASPSWPLLWCLLAGVAALGAVAALGLLGAGEPRDEATGAVG
jgi:predicted MFS family arabinose efflux permease